MALRRTPINLDDDLTDYNDPTAISRRVYRKVNLATGTIEYTRYATTFGDSYTDLSNSPSENQPTAVQAISGYNSATNYYEYGFNWTASNVTLWVVNPSNGQKLYSGIIAGQAHGFPKIQQPLWSICGITPIGHPNAVRTPPIHHEPLVRWMLIGCGSRHKAISPVIRPRQVLPAICKHPAKPTTA